MEFAPKLVEKTPVFHTDLLIIFSEPGDEISTPLTSTAKGMSYIT